LKIYVEGIEVVDPDAGEPDFIRLELDDDLTEEQAIELIKSLMIPPYIIRKHYCHHDEDPKKPCAIELIEEVR